MNAGDIAILKAENERLRLLYRVSNVIHSTLDPQKALRLIVDEAVTLVGASSGSVALINPNTGLLEIEASKGLPEAARNTKLPLGEGITGWVARTGRPARVGDVSKDSRYVLLNHTVRSELAVPLEVNGEVRGVLNVDSDRPDAFSASDQELLTELAAQASQVILKTWLHEQLRLKADLFETLNAVSKNINTAMSLGEVLQLITREACLLMQAKMCSVLLVDETGEWLDLRANYGAGPAYISKPRLSKSESLLGIVVRRKKPMQVENVQRSSQYQNVEVARREGLVSLLSVPLVFAGEAIGTLSVYTGEPHSFSNEEIQILSSLGQLSAIALEKARLYERLVNVEEELRQNEKLSAIGLLAAEVAHEIRNPLTVMKMLFHSLDLKFPEGDPRTVDARIMGEKMEHMNKIVEQILDFAKRSEPKFVPVDVNELIEDLSLLTRHKLKHQGIQWVRNLRVDLPGIQADPVQLEQAFLNLTLNAVEAMPIGGVLTINTGPDIGKKGKPGVRIEFTDTGEGMSAEQQNRLFTSLLATTKLKGTGLGFAIVHRIVEVHHGEVEVSSTPGKGTTIRVYLPCEQD